MVKAQTYRYLIKGFGLLPPLKKGRENFKKKPRKNMEVFEVITITKT